MNAERKLSKKQSVYKFMLYLIINTELFLSITSGNSMAFELEKDEYQRKFEKVTYSLDPIGHIQSYSHRLEEIIIFLLKTTVYIFSTIILIAGIGFIREH